MSSLNTIGFLRDMSLVALSCVFVTSMNNLFNSPSSTIASIFGFSFVCLLVYLMNTNDRDIEDSQIKEGADK